MNKREKIFFQLFANCIPVKGQTRSALYDLQREKIELIPNDMFDVINDFKSNSINEITNKYGTKNGSIIIEYMDFLEKNEYGFYCTDSELSLFPELDLNFYNPSMITNLVLELSSTTLPILNEIIEEMEELGCKDCQLISYNKLDSEQLLTILGTFQKTRIKSINLITKYSTSFSKSFLEQLTVRFLRLNQVYFFGAGKDEKYSPKRHSLVKIEFIREDFNDSKSCGLISANNFSVNLPRFTESLNHNSCLNRKISIDVDGMVKNCPAMPKSYGKFKRHKLLKIVQNKEFRKHWNITKEQIDTCQVCEFRHACTDCRAFIENPHDIKSKPLKCGYNPKTCKWEDWSTNPLKEKAVLHYELTELNQN